MSREAYNYKRKAVSAAKDLCYSTETINKLKSAQSVAEIERIMITERRSR